MNKLFTVGFWETVARLILRNRIGIILVIVGFTFLFSLQWEKMRFTYTEANLLPDDHEVNINYNNFLKTFGDEGNLIVLGVKDSALFTVENLNAWNKLSSDFISYEEVETVISIKDLQKLVKNTKNKQFELKPFIKDSIKTLEEITILQDELFEKYPFYDNFLFNKNSKVVRSAIYLDKRIVNTSDRKDFVMNTLIPIIKDFESATNLDVRVSGMPYIRTLNSQNIIDEILQDGEDFLMASDIRRHTECARIANILTNIPMPDIVDVTAGVSPEVIRYIEDKMEEMFERCKQYVDDKLNN